jgi:hypothetical protein
MKHLSICWQNRIVSCHVWPIGLRVTHVWGGRGLCSLNWNMGGFSDVFLTRGFRGV